MAGIPQDQMMAIIGRSRNLIHEDSRQERRGGGRPRGGYEDNFYDADDDYTDPFSSDIMGENCIPPAGQKQGNYTDERVMRSGLPDNVKQSMMAKRINESDMQETAFLDKMATQAPKKQQIREAVQPAGVDYTALKAIINECLNEYFAKHPINENVAKVNKVDVSNGNKIRVIYEGGIVYDGELEYKGKLKSKQ